MSRIIRRVFAFKNRCRIAADRYGAWGIGYYERQTKPLTKPKLAPPYRMINAASKADAISKARAFGFESYIDEENNEVEVPL